MTGFSHQKSQIGVKENRITTLSTKLRRLICQVTLGRTGWGNIPADCQVTSSTFNPTCVDDGSVNEHVYVYMLVKDSSPSEGTEEEVGASNSSCHIFPYPKSKDSHHEVKDSQAVRDKHVSAI
jgi:hypothetical protein